MKIAVIGIRGLPANYSGFETCAEHTTKYWADNENEVLVFCRKNRYSDRPTSYGKVKLKFIGQFPGKSLETLSHTLFSILNLCLVERSYKNVHLYNTGNAIYLPILKLFGKKTAISVDGIEWKRDKWGRLAKTMYKIGEWFAYKFADEIIVDNKEIEDYYIDRFNKATTLIAYGAKIIKSEEQAKTYLEANSLVSKNYFLFVGRLVPEKGVHNLIEAYNKLNTDLPLVIIGDDHSESDYKAQLFSKQSDKIRFLGFKYGNEYEQILANALLYVSASHLEGTSPSLLAAMGANVCALVNGIPENKNTVNDAAVTFEENDFDDLVSKWSHLIKSKDEIEKMQQKGFEHVQKFYTWDAISKQYLNMFSKIGSKV